MNFDAIVQGRRSIRGYKIDPIPKKVLEEIIQIATRAPSSMTTQP
ncbi:MAG: nitroreductase family protein [Sneathiella sp.]